MTTPPEHLAEAQKLTADGLVDLIEIHLKDGVTVFYMKEAQTLPWQGQLYQGAAFQLSGDSRSSEGQEARPNLRVMNPLGIFNLPAKQGKLDYATIIRKRVLRQHLLSDVNIFDQRMWYVSRVAELIANQFVSLELRSMSEGPNYQIPVRMYMPPEFPTVTL